MLSTFGITDAEKCWSIQERSANRSMVFTPLQVPFSAASGGSEDYENETFVWGTNIRAQKVSRDFVNFFELFIEQGGFEAKYITLMREVRSRGVIAGRCTHHSCAAEEVLCSLPLIQRTSNRSAYSVLRHPGRILQPTVSNAFCAAMQLPAGQGQVNVDSYDIYAYDPELYKMLIKYPAEMITLMDDAVKLAYADATQQNAEDVTLQVASLTVQYL